MGGEIVAQQCHVGEAAASTLMGGPAGDDNRREALHERLIAVLRGYGAESGRMVEVFAAAQQMHRTDLHALLVIMDIQRTGHCATPKTLTEALKLTSGAVTGVVDRLVRSGHVQRETDNFDRRQVKLVYREPAKAVTRDFFEPLATRMCTVMGRYSEEELATVERFLSDAAQALTDYIRQIAPTPKETANSAPRPHV